MKLSAPKKNTFYISVALAVLALLGQFDVVSGLTSNAHLLGIAAYVVLAAGNYLKGF